MEVLCWWVRGEQEKKSRIKNMVRGDRMYVGEWTSHRVHRGECRRESGVSRASTWKDVPEEIVELISGQKVVS